ncbi:MAG: hypothetical protein C0501_30075 [Isosphaera sp.]|nr:hypothetical protein [Isosphaera sp.]
MRLTMTLVALAAASAAADDKPAARAVDLAGVKLVWAERAGTPAAVEVASADELAKSKAFADDASRDAVRKRVDFGKEKLVVFAWSGSGGDKLTPAVAADGAKTTATFAYRAGATDDLRRHGLVFAVPKDAAVKVVRAER